MLITNNNSMWGTVYDDINRAALQMKVGDCLSFGSFVPQTDSFGIEIRFPMIWHVIDRKENKLKLLSCFFFEHNGYWPNKGDSESVTWKDTEIRYNLNNNYYNECFNESEQEAILTTKVKTCKKDSESIITNDKLYIPSLKEIQNIPEHLKVGRYISAEEDRSGTPVARLGYCFYWLRDPGEYPGANLIVQGYVNSKLTLDSLSYDSDEVGVRAIMWVDAEKIKGNY